MAIPGLKPSYDVKAKVRIGKKNEKGYPQSVDYFICDDPEFVSRCPGAPKELRIEFPFADAADNFSTGLEYWRGKQLSCYSKGEEKAGETVAYRVNSLLGEFKVIGDPMGRGKERTPIACPFRSCPNFEARECKPMGRLQFFLAGENTMRDEVYQLDTKSWNTIEGMEATLAQARGDLRGRTFILTVAMEQKANQRFPVVSLREEAVKIENANDVEIADVLLFLRTAVDTYESNPTALRPALAAALDATRPGWRDKPEFAARIKEVGVVFAANNLLDRYEL